MTIQLNDNKTFIYRIRRKSDGLFLNSSINHNTPLVYDQTPSYWGSTGVFWRKPETVRKNLLALCTRYYYIFDEQQTLFRNRAHGGSETKKQLIKRNIKFVVCRTDTPIHRCEPIYPWLDKYEVIATEITVHGECIMEAREFASFLADKGNLAKT